MNKQLLLKDNLETDYGFDEAMKTLRTNILFSGNGIRTIMLTSALPNEGKSELTFSVAVSMANIGKRVLLIDADVRKSVFVARHQIGEKVDGLSQYLSGQKTLEEVLYPTDIENLDVITAGPYAPNPAELLEENLFVKLIAYGRHQYDYVFIDTPPMADLIDGAIVARLCDGAIMVIESGSVRFRMEQGVKKQLEKSGCRILGAILNKQERAHGRYYKRYGKYERYYGEYRSVDE